MFQKIVLSKRHNYKIVFSIRQLPDRVDDLPERPFLARHRRRPEWAGESAATSSTASGDNRLQLLETGQNQNLLRQLKIKLNE